MGMLTYEGLRDAVAGGGVALRSRVRLLPAGGPGDKVMPPTYGVDRGAVHRYAVEERMVDGAPVLTVLLDSVASQAARFELALLEGWERGELRFPVPFVDFAGDPEVADLGRITVLEAPHRLADAIFRDSLLEGTLFRLSEVGRAVTEAHPRRATSLFRYAPSALLFGMWDSTGPKGGQGAKFQRAFVSEIVGFDAVVGKGVSSRIDPLQIERYAATVYKHADPAQGWTLDPAEAAVAADKPLPVGKGGDLGRPSQVNHGNVTPSIDSQGVTISTALQTTVLSLVALRRLRFPVASDGSPIEPAELGPAETAARTAVAAIGVAALAYLPVMGYDLRSRCLLVPEHPPRVELVGRDGSAEAVEVDPASAAGILDEAAAAAAGFGLGWHEGELRLVPAPKLVDLVKASRMLASSETPEG